MLFILELLLLIEAWIREVEIGVEGRDEGGVEKSLVLSGIGDDRRLSIDGAFS